MCVGPTDAVNLLPTNLPLSSALLLPICDLGHFQYDAISTAEVIPAARHLRAQRQRKERAVGSDLCPVGISSRSRVTSGHALLLETREAREVCVGGEPGRPRGVAPPPLTL